MNSRKVKNKREFNFTAYKKPSELHYALVSNPYVDYETPLDDSFSLNNPAFYERLIDPDLRERCNPKQKTQQPVNVNASSINMMVASQPQPSHVSSSSVAQVKQSNQNPIQVDRKDTSGNDDEDDYVLMILSETSSSEEELSVKDLIQKRKEEADKLKVESKNKNKSPEKEEEMIDVRSTNIAVIPHSSINSSPATSNQEDLITSKELFEKKDVNAKDPVLNEPVSSKEPEKKIYITIVNKNLLTSQKSSSEKVNTLLSGRGDGVRDKEVQIANNTESTNLKSSIPNNDGTNFNKFQLFVLI